MADVITIEADLERIAGNLNAAESVQTWDAVAVEAWLVGEQGFVPAGPSRRAGTYHCEDLDIRLLQRDEYRLLRVR